MITCNASPLGILKAYWRTTRRTRCFLAPKEHCAPTAIKSVFERFFAEFAKPGVSFARKQLLIVGEYAYIVWTAEQPRIRRACQRYFCYSERKHSIASSDGEGFKPKH